MTHIAGWFVVFVMTAVSLVWAQSPSGTPEEAKAMVERAVDALKKDPAKALASFNTGTDGFKNKDLYVFCYDLATGLASANLNNPDMVGKVKLADLKDKAGKELGKEFLSTAVEGAVKETPPYQWNRPGESEVSNKFAYITKVGNQLCGCGYHKPKS